MSSICRKSSDEHTKKDENIQGPGKDVEDEGGAGAGILKERETRGAIEVGDESEAQDLERSYMRQCAMHEINS